MENIFNSEELENTLGENIRVLRLQKNLDRKTLAVQAGVSLGTLRNLELGLGSSLKTLVCVVRALGKEDWLMSIAPKVVVNPLNMVRSSGVRRRARKKKGYGGQEENK